MAKRIIDKDKLSELWNKGLTATEISKITGWKADTMYKYIHRIGLKRHKSGYKSLFEREPEKKEWFIRNYPEMSNDTISAYLGISPDRIGELGRQLGLRKSETYWQGIKEYHKKKVREFHDTKKGDMDYYAYNKRPRKNGKFIKKEDNANIY